MKDVKIGKNMWISKSAYIDELNPDDIINADNSAIVNSTTIFTHLYFGPEQEKSTREDFVKGLKLIRRKKNSP